MRSAHLRADHGRFGTGSTRLGGVAREIDQFSVKTYLDRHGLAPGDARDALEAGIRTEFGAEPEEASALELLFNLPTVDGRRLHRLTKSDERYLISGGTDQVAKALTAEHSRDIRLNKRLAAVDIRGSSVRLTFADGERVTADRVILAVPRPAARDPDRRRTATLWRASSPRSSSGRTESHRRLDNSAWRRTIGFGGASGGGEFSAPGKPSRSRRARPCRALLFLAATR